MAVRHLRQESQRHDQESKLKMVTNERRLFRQLSTTPIVMYDPFNFLQYCQNQLLSMQLLAPQQYFRALSVAMPPMDTPQRLVLCLGQLRGPEVLVTILFFH